MKIHRPAFQPDLFSPKPEPLRVLIACETTGTVRDAFRRAGHYAVSCDLLPTQIPGQHVQGDVLTVLDQGWDLMVAHPSCQYLARSGMHWTIRGKRDPQHTEDALDFVRLLMDAPIERIAVENPPGAIGTRIRPADQYVQPNKFGDDASKLTGFWLKNLPQLQPTGIVDPRLVGHRKRWANQTDSGQNREGPAPDRWLKRAATYSGLAEAMADQWGGQTGWRQVSFSNDCICEACDADEQCECNDSACGLCGDLYAEVCDCPGPTQPDMEYQTWCGDVMMGRTV